MKADNVIVFPDGLAGEGSVGGADVVLIDYERAKELQRLDYQLKGNAAGDEALMCRRMGQDKSWGVDSDLHGLCTVAFVLLFGKDEKEMVEANADGTSRLNRVYTIRRYWTSSGLLTSLFGTFLNFDPIEDDYDDVVVVLRDKFDAYVRENNNEVEEALTAFRSALSNKS